MRDSLKQIKKLSRKFGITSGQAVYIFELYHKLATSFINQKEVLDLIQNSVIYPNQKLHKETKRVVELILNNESISNKSLEPETQTRSMEILTGYTDSFKNLIDKVYGGINKVKVPNRISEFYSKKPAIGKVFTMIVQITPTAGRANNLFNTFFSVDCTVDYSTTVYEESLMSKFEVLYIKYDPYFILLGYLLLLKQSISDKGFFIPKIKNSIRDLENFIEEVSSNPNMEIGSFNRAYSDSRFIDNKLVLKA